MTIYWPFSQSYRSLIYFASSLTCWHKISECANITNLLNIHVLLKFREDCLPALQMKIIFFHSEFSYFSSPKKFFCCKLKKTFLNAITKQQTLNSPRDSKLRNSRILHCTMDNTLAFCSAALGSIISVSLFRNGVAKIWLHRILVRVLQKLLDCRSKIDN